MATDPDPGVFALIAETNRDRLIAQRQATERIETKGTILLGFALAALQFLVTRTDANTAWQVAAVVAYGLAFASGLVVVVPYQDKFPPDPAGFLVAFQEAPLHLAQKFLAGMRARAFTENVKLTKRKERFWWLTLSLLAIGVALSSISIA